MLYSVSFTARDLAPTQKLIIPRVYRCVRRVFCLLALLLRNSVHRLWLLDAPAQGDIVYQYQCLATNVDCVPHPTSRTEDEDGSVAGALIDRIPVRRPEMVLKHASSATVTTVAASGASYAWTTRLSWWK